MNFTLITALLCSFSLISVCVCEFHTVEVQPGEDVTLMCSNFTTFTSHIIWFRLANTPNISCISSMSSAEANATYCDGFKNSKFNMTSITTTLFLMIQQVDLSDSGLYFCGCYKDEKTVIDSATFLKVQGSLLVRLSLGGILGAVTFFLIIVVSAVTVEIIKRWTAGNEENNSQQSEILHNEDLIGAALTSCSTAGRNRRSASEKELETRVVYTARR